MTVLYILDTDHLTLLQRNHPGVRARCAPLQPDIIATTVVSTMEQIRARLAQLHRAKTAHNVIEAFARFQETLMFYRTVPVLSYDEAAAAHFAHLRGILHPRPGTQDLRIAAVAVGRHKCHSMHSGTSGQGGNPCRVCPGLDGVVPFWSPG